MKKSIGYIIGIGLFVFSPLIAKAGSINLSLNCPESGKAGETISCCISASSSANINGVTANYNFDSGVSLVSFTPSSGLSNYGSSVKGFAVGNTNGVGNSTKVGTLKVTLPSNATSNQTYKIGLTNVGGSDTNFDDLSGSSVSKSVRIKSNINTLSSLSISGANINFSENNTSYSATVSSETIVISATAKDSRASVSGTGTKTLNYGNNTFNITVTSEDGNKKVYTISINRPVPAPSDNTPSKTEEKKENKNPNNSNSTGGNNTTSKSSNALLKSLVIGGTNISFSQSVFNYETNVEYDTDKITIEAVAADSKSKVTIPTNLDLTVGRNEFLVTVTAEDGSTKVYTIIVNRKEEGIIISNNNNLASLEIVDHNINFNKDTYDYEITTNLDSLEIKASAEDEKAKIEIVGNENLENGSKIIVRVTAEDGSTKEYNINIKKKQQSNALGFIIGGIVVVIALVGTFIFVKRKNK